MFTVLEALQLSADFLERKGIESPRLNAELMLSHILKCKRLNLYLCFDQPLQDEELKLYREFLVRRGKAEPLQYILGEVEFYGIPLIINPAVLIPRQETEILVESVINYCKQRTITKILDIGTGSGNIAVALAMHLKDAVITAIDFSLEALETAKLNAEKNAVGERVICRLVNIITESHALPEDFGLVVSNPPYISREEFETLRPELRIYEPASALTDYSDGLSFYKAIISGAGKWLKHEGALFLEAGEGQAERVKELMVKNSFNNICTHKDYLDIDRVVSGELN